MKRLTQDPRFWCRESVGMNPHSHLPIQVPFSYTRFLYAAASLPTLTLAGQVQVEPWWWPTGPVTQDFFTIHERGFAAKHLPECVCVCLCLCVRVGGSGEGDKKHHQKQRKETEGSQREKAKPRVQGQHARSKISHDALSSGWQQRGCEVKLKEDQKGYVVRVGWAVWREVLVFLSCLARELSSHRVKLSGPPLPGPTHTHWMVSKPRLKKGSELSPLRATVREFGPRPLYHLTAGNSRAHEAETTFMTKIRA